METGGIRSRCMGLELIQIKPQVVFRIELYTMGVVQQYSFVWKTAVDVPQGGGEAAARFAFRLFAEEEPCQPVPGLGLAAMTHQIG